MSVAPDRQLSVVWRPLLSVSPEWERAFQDAVDTFNVDRELVALGSLDTLGQPNLAVAAYLASDHKYVDAEGLVSTFLSEMASCPPRRIAVLACGLVSPPVSEQDVSHLLDAQARSSGVTQHALRLFETGDLLAPLHQLIRLCARSDLGAEVRRELTRPTMMEETTSEEVPQWKKHMNQ